MGDNMSWLEQEKVHASRDGLGDITQGAETTILPRISIYYTIGSSLRASHVINRKGLSFLLYQ